jgi:hypothetical protein
MNPDDYFKGIKTGTSVATNHEIPMLVEVLAEAVDA